MPDRKLSRGSARERLIGYPVLLGLALLATCDLIDEAEVAASRSALRAQDLVGAPVAEASQVSHAPAEAGTPRVLLNHALSLARSAAQMAVGTARDEHLARARSMAADARDARPLWAEADVVAAYIDSLQASRRQAAVGRLADSYVAAPFMLDAADWRIRYGLSNWDSLAPSTRGALIEESFWLMGIDAARAADLNMTIRNSDAYRSFMLRFRTLTSQAPDRP